METAFDIIVIGAGSAGCVMASRLSEDPRLSVCLLEAGGVDRSPLIHVPMGLGGLIHAPALDWGYSTTPQANLANRRMKHPRGRVLGGSSSINAMCYIRGMAADYEDWCLPGWGWQDMLPAFKRAESNTRGADDFHGDKGPLGVDDLRHLSEISQDWGQAAQAAGLPWCDDFNQGQPEGIGPYQVTQRDGQRCSAAAGYLTEQVRQRPNLTIVTDATVRRLILTDRHVTGVDLGLKGKITARAQVVLSAGAINSPHILMLSGIGPADHLAEMGVKPIVDGPMVGQNLQDHLDVILSARLRGGGYGIAPGFVLRGPLMLLDYLRNRSGPLSSNLAEMGGFARSSAEADRPDLQFHLLPVLIEDHGHTLHRGYGLSLHVCDLAPESRGQIRLTGPHGTDAPAIDPNYLSAPGDWTRLIAGGRLAAKTLSHAPVANQITGWVMPVPGHPADWSDAEWRQAIAQKAESIYHPVGTVAMGLDQQAPLRPDCTLRGVEGLSVVDASIMPRIIRGNTNAPVIAMAELAAERLRDRLRP
ncbi:MAG: GMC family oxidoreductase N-terminal domain-containing protein [Alphaproteobacteria bacterium]